MEGSNLGYYSDLTKIANDSSKFRVTSNHSHDGNGGTFWTSMGIVPMILEDNNTANKKIIFATIHNSVRITNYWGWTMDNTPFEEYNFFNDYNFELFNDDSSSNPNVIFMKNTIYDYSDDLWETLNSNYIASSEINDFVDNYSPPSSSPEESNDIIVSDITNPETMANGIILLLISMIIVVTCSAFLIKKRLKY